MFGVRVIGSPTSVPTNVPDVHESEKRATVRDSEDSTRALMRTEDSLKVRCRKQQSKYLRRSDDQVTRADWRSVEVYTKMFP
jgi:hypothetical protein